AGGRVALADHFAGGGRVAKHVDDVGLPIGGAVARIGGIERRLLVGVVRMLLAELVELLRRRVGRHRLREELVLHVRVEERLHLVDRVGAGRQRRLHHEPGVLQDLLARVLLQRLVREVAGYGESQHEYAEQYEVELPYELHAVLSFLSCGRFTSRAPSWARPCRSSSWARISPD